MDFRLTEDQRALKRGVRELLDARFGRAALRAAVDAGGALDRALWRELGAAGFFALRLPEADGGVGLGLPEAALVFEEAGRALLPGPLIATHLAAGRVPGAAEGEAVVARADGELVEWLDAADAVLGSVDAAVPIRSVDPLTPLHRLPGGPAPAEADTASLLTAAEADTASLLTAAEQLGSAARTTELAVAHARVREQFGQPIGAFQGVKHQLADLACDLEPSRALWWYAAHAFDHLREKSERHAAIAKAHMTDLYDRVTRSAIELHGGIGFTWEFDLHLWWRRAVFDRAYLGEASWHRERAAGLAGW
jgi:alkylation response protein AidB-like acyl-CoA dehydrogenase